MNSTPLILLCIVIAYFGVLYLISHFVSRKSSDNDAFFLGNKKSPWWVVAIAMIGSSISGVTFVSVPGWVRESNMTYMQMVLGFFFGYLIVAYILLPLYYKLNLTSIYGYLGQRFGKQSMKTGSSFFILSKITGSATKLYLVIMILQSLIFAHWGIPFYLTVTGSVLLIWLYTRRSGIKTIIWTDLLQTICFLLALVLIIYQVISQLEINALDAVKTVQENPHSKIFVFDDWGSKQNFFKQFFSGIFIVIVMTGLDQDMMQKNLTCKTLKDSQKNMLSYGITFAPINLLFLSLGVLLLIFADQRQIELPNISDNILPFLAEQYLGFTALILFVIGIVAAAFSSADSALASITTSICIDLLDTDQKSKEKAQSTRKAMHILVCVAFILTIILIDYLGQSSIIDVIYRIASYTYGPLLGLFCFGLFTKISVKDKLVPYICIASPLICFAVEEYLFRQFGYIVGYELLMFNAILTIIGLLFISSKRTEKQI